MVGRASVPARKMGGQGRPPHRNVAPEETFPSGLKLFTKAEACENHVKQPPPAEFCRRGRLLYNIIDLPKKLLG